MGDTNYKILGTTCAGHFPLPCLGRDEELSTLGYFPRSVIETGNVKQTVISKILPFPLGVTFTDDDPGINRTTIVTMVTIRPRFIILQNVSSSLQHVCKIYDKTWILNGSVTGRVSRLSLSTD